MMEERERKEEKNKRIGALTSVGVQVLLVILFYFIVAWREPFLPIPEYGIELGFTTSAGAESAAPAPAQVVETEEVQEEEETLEQIEEVNPTENQETSTEVVEETETTSQEIEDVPVIEKEEKSKPVENVVEEKKEVDDRAVMKSNEEQSDKDGDGKSDSESENREVDKRAIYGTQGNNTGNNEGASLSMAGWIWDFKPKPNDTSDESGKIEYKIVVDQDGYLVKIETITSNVSPAVERKYRQAVEKLTFSKTGDNKSASLSTGTVTFIIKSK